MNITLKPLSYGLGNLEYGRFTDYDVRNQAYRAVFAGVCGHTYDCHSVWQMYSPKFAPTTSPCFYWDEALSTPGAYKMILLKNLLLSLPFLTRIPAPDLLPNITNPTYTKPMERLDPLRASHPVATIDSKGSYGLVYFPQANQYLEVNLNLFI